MEMEGNLTQHSGYESGGPCQRETELAEPRLGTSRVRATVNHLGRPTYPALGEPAIYLMVSEKKPRSKK